MKSEMKLLKDMSEQIHVQYVFLNLDLNFWGRLCKKVIKVNYD